MSTASSDAVVASFDPSMPRTCGSIFSFFLPLPPSDVGVSKFSEACTIVPDEGQRCFIWVQFGLHQSGFSMLCGFKAG